MIEWIFKEYYVMNDKPIFIVFLLLILVIIFVTIFFVVKEIKNESK